jgi:uncharacterized membrane protein
LSGAGYRREALLGSVTGIIGVAFAGALLGPQLVLFPLRWLQIGAGTVLIYFGWITIGLSSTAWLEALTGASIALALTVGLVISLHGYLQRLPDVFLKLGAGLMLLTLGTFWTIEGLALKWPMGELSAVPLFVSFCYLAGSQFC